ncbi:MAG: hypothetical protein KJO31_03315 [Gammaproteobacteria bacterium]|nr:hypothetical protein [Gammaproteobacteria bacterium]
MAIENTMSRFAEKARDQYEGIIAGAQLRANDAATRVSKGKKPVKRLSQLGSDLTAVSHRTTDKVLQQNTKLIEHQIDAVAGRLKAAADARGVRDLVGTQIRMIPEHTALFVGDARDSLKIVANAGSEVKGLLELTFNELRGRTPRRAKPAAKKTAKKTVRKTAKKRASAKKSPAKKTQAAA